MDDNNFIKTPFFNFLGNLGFSQFGNFHYFDTGTLFWSLTRIFGIYYRIINSCFLYDKEEDERHTIFLAEDIENFIIRFRVVMNDLAYVLRKFYPENVRGLAGTRGKVHPLNKEMSFRELFDFIEKTPNFHHNLYKVFLKNKPALLLLKEQRENIIHYKSKAFIFYFKNKKLEFAMISAAGDEPHEKTEKGGEKIITTSVFNFVNGQMLFLYNFMNVDLLTIYEDFVKNNNWKYKEIGKNGKMSCIGVKIFRKINNI